VISASWLKNKMAIIKKISNDAFIKNSIIYFSGSMIVAFLNYLYHPVLGRIMNIDDFGEVQALISLFLQLTIIVGIFSITTVNITSNIENEKERNEIISELRNVSLYITAFLFLIILIFSSQLQSFLNFKSFYPFISLAFILLLQVFTSIRTSFLQGLNKFKSVSLAGIISSGGRLLFGAALVIIGLKSFGAITGIMIAQVITLAYVFYKSKNNLNLKFNSKIILNSRLKKELKYALLVLFSTICITFLYTADVLFIKHYFSPEEAGLYSGIATIGRIIFFLAGPISAVMLPSIKLKNSVKDNEKILFKSLFIVILIGGLASLTFYLFYDMIIGILIGNKYLVLAKLLPKLAIMLFLVSIINIIFNYYLALRKFFLIPIAIIGILSATILTAINHNNFNSIINNFIYSEVIIFILLFVNYAKTNIYNRTNL